MLNLCNCPPNNQGQFTAYSNIIIHYPGYKKNGDYRLEIQGGTVPSHSDICKILHNLIVNNRYSFSVLEQLLEDIYENGTLTDYEDRNLKYLQNLIFWVTLQEEINYPRTKPWFAGRNLAFAGFMKRFTAPGRNPPSLSGMYWGGVIITERDGQFCTGWRIARGFIII